jgi:hypothetical protein
MMHSLTFTCPQTGRAIDAGVNTDPHSLSSVQATIIQLRCPHCGMTHQLPIKSGYLARPFYWSSLIRPMRRALPQIAGPKFDHLDRQIFNANLPEMPG